MNGDPKRSSKGELVAGADSVIELSVEGVDAPDECAVDAGVIVAARSRETNLPFSRGWPFQELFRARLLVNAENKCPKENVYNTFEARGDSEMLGRWTLNGVTLDDVTWDVRRRR